MNDISFQIVWTGETLLIAIRDGEVEPQGLTPLIVPDLCGDVDKMPERRGQVATAIVPPRLRDDWASAEKSLPRGLYPVKHNRTFGIHQDADPAGCPLLVGRLPPANPTCIGWVMAGHLLASHFAVEVLQGLLLPASLIFEKGLL